MSAWPNAPFEQEEKARAGGESWLFILIKRQMGVSIMNLSGGAPTSRSNRRNGTPQPAPPGNTSRPSRVRSHSRSVQTTDRLSAWSRPRGR
jgi:hypothetical protein